MAISQTFNQDFTTGNIGTAAAVTTAAPSYTTGTTAALSLTTTGLLRVDGSGVTQPISATSLPLPAGASTSALQTSGNATLSAISAQLPAVLGQTTMAGSLSVVIASNQSTVPVSFATSGTGTLTSVAGSATSVVLLASSGTTKGFIVYNDSAAILYVAYSATSTTSAFSEKLYPNSATSLISFYTGVVSGIWASATGSARVTQFT